MIAVDLLDLREAWGQWCADRGLRPASALRELVRATLSQTSKVPPTVAAVITHSPERPTLRREIALTPSEMDRVTELAAADGYSPSKWLSAVVRFHLTRTPQFGGPELDALAASNLRLAMIGRQLQQLNRLLMDAAEDGPEVIMTDDIRREISAHTLQVSRLIASNLERWTLR